MEKSICIEVPGASESDLYLNVFGHSVTEPLHKAGPRVKSFYLIHYILDGEGAFTVNNLTYHLKKGQGFLIEPDYQVSYIADKTNPWTYVWVGFSGREAGKMLHAIGLSQENPIFACEEGEKLKKYVFDMLAHNYSNQADSYRLTGMLYLFLSAIAKSQQTKIETPSGNTYVNHAVAYIQNHYSLPVSVEEISDYVGINRSYLCSLFKEYTGMSPIKYLQNFRVTRAQHMLTVTDISVESIALSCGYQSAEAFHKIFKQLTGMSPKTFRKEKRERTLLNREKLRINGTGEAEKEEWL